MRASADAPAAAQPAAPALRRFRISRPAVLGLLAVEMLTGAFIYATAVERPGALLVVVHALLGLALTAPGLARRFRKDASAPAWTFSGALAFFSAAAVVLSGLALAYQALFSPAVAGGLDLVHLVSVCLLLAATLPRMAHAARRRLMAAA